MDRAGVAHTTAVPGPDFPVKPTPSAASRLATARFQPGPSRAKPRQAGPVGISLALGDSNQVIADCTRAIELDPRLAVAYWSRGIAYARKGDQKRALADQRKALELDPSLGQQ